jgi:HAMP domain-containing protein
MSAAEQKSGRNRRSIFNIRFLRGSKLRAVFAVMTAGMIISAIMIANVMSIVKGAVGVAAGRDPALANFLEQIRDTVLGVLGVGLVFVTASAVISLLFGLMVSHRFYGPIVPLSRHLRELREGKLSARVKLRPGDELVELMDAQNALAESLERKFGKQP